MLVLDLLQESLGRETLKTSFTIISLDELEPLIH